MVPIWMDAKEATKGGGTISTTTKKKFFFKSTVTATFGTASQGEWAHVMPKILRS